VAEIIPIDRISTDGTQTRAELNDTVIAEYAEAYEQGSELPPIDVYYDDVSYFLADSFHRLKAAQKIGRDIINANVHPGDQRDAILHAVGANERHGLRRNSSDRRRAVLLLLNDPEWGAWANTEIARQCNVSEFLVRTIRNELPPAGPKPAKERTRKARRGATTYPMKTENIGAKKPERETPGVSGSTTTEPQHNGEAHLMVSRYGHLRYYRRWNQRHQRLPHLTNRQHQISSKRLVKPRQVQLLLTTLALI
jgi:hypothetical protein